uniref:Uncharacterized protein n=1 Tax=Candidatus Methanophagaceae archaeon ANME-1 ERB6 TaxID=2759912 RepID=A0A7G9YUP4_9EURY|nr:hypothetical protein GMKFMAKO_00045 [Methanosarcinales archaeon ANME-1 ERB6]
MSFRKGLRNCNWIRLRFLDKALFRAAMGYTKRGRSIVNGLLVEKLLGVIAKMLETSGARVFRRAKRMECLHGHQD